MAQSKPKPLSLIEPRPKPFGVGEIRVEPVRKPKNAPPGVWYWRAVKYEKSSTTYPWVGIGTKAEAARAVAELLAAGDVNRRQKQRRQNVIESVQDLLEFHIGYLSDQRDAGILTAGTVKARTGAARRLIGPLGQLPLSDIHQGVIEGYAKQRLKAGAAPSSIHLDLRELRQALAWAADSRLIPLSVRFKMPALPNETRRNRYTPNMDELSQLLAHMDPHTWPALAVRLLAGIGARLGEIAQLRWVDVDLYQTDGTWAGWVRLHGRGKVGQDTRRGKTGERVVPVCADLAEQLVSCRPTPERWLEPVLGVAPSTVIAKLHQYLTAACKAAGLPRWNPTGFRRHVSEHLLGIPDVDVVSYGAFMGHDPQTALKHYAQGRPVKLAHLAEKLRIPGGPAQPTRTTAEPPQQNAPASKGNRGAEGTPKGIPAPSISAMSSSSEVGPSGPSNPAGPHNPHSSAPSTGIRKTLLRKWPMR